VLVNNALDKHVVQPASEKVVAQYAELKETKTAARNKALPIQDPDSVTGRLHAEARRLEINASAMLNTVPVLVKKALEKHVIQPAVEKVVAQYTELKETKTAARNRARPIQDPESLTGVLHAEARRLDIKTSAMLGTVPTIMAKAFAKQVVESPSAPAESVEEEAPGESQALADEKRPGSQME
jgi:hypothetical protein